MEVLEKDVFKGGIKKGTIATDAAAAKLDKQCKNARDLLSAELSIIYGSLLQMKKSIPGTAKRVGCVPDGGLWYYKGRLIVAVEGKKQNKDGNAIERGYKNLYICHSINPEISYLTFAIGHGACDTEAIGKTLDWAHPYGYNVPNTFGNSCYMKVEGFTDTEVYSILRSTIVDTIAAIDGIHQ